MYITVNINVVVIVRCCRFRGGGHTDVDNGLTSFHDTFSLEINLFRSVCDRNRWFHMIYYPPGELRTELFYTRIHFLWTLLIL